jgi:hypothetical protein
MKLYLWVRHGLKGIRNIREPTRTKMSQIIVDNLEEIMVEVLSIPCLKTCSVEIKSTVCNSSQPFGYSA